MGNGSPGRGARWPRSCLTWVGGHPTNPRLCARPARFSPEATDRVFQAGGRHDRPCLELPGERRPGSVQPVQADRGTSRQIDALERGARARRRQPLRQLALNLARRRLWLGTALSEEPETLADGLVREDCAARVEGLEPRRKG